jgi:hypothetical protein
MILRCYQEFPMPIFDLHGEQLLNNGPSSNISYLARFIFSMRTSSICFKWAVSPPSDGAEPGEWCFDLAFDRKSASRVDRSGVTHFDGVECSRIDP